MPAKSLELKHTIKLIRINYQKLMKLEMRIKFIMDKINFNTYNPVSVTIQELWIIAEIGDFNRQIQLINTLAPERHLLPTNPAVIRELLPHMEKRGSRYLRYYFLYNANKTLLDEIRYLGKKRSEGKHYNVALSHATKKLVRLIFAMENLKTTIPTNSLILFINILFLSTIYDALFNMPFLRFQYDLKDFLINSKYLHYSLDF